MTSIMTIGRVNDGVHYAFSFNLIPWQARDVTKDFSLFQLGLLGSRRSGQQRDFSKITDYSWNNFNWRPAVCRRNFLDEECRVLAAALLTIRPNVSGGQSDIDHIDHTRMYHAILGDL